LPQRQTSFELNGIGMRNLPHVNINGVNILIDTGSSINLINPGHPLIRKSWEEKFIITTANNETMGTHACEIQIPQLSKETLNCKIYKFSEKYDVLLGNPALLKLEAHIDLHKGNLSLKNNVLPLLGLNIEQFKKGENVITLKTECEDGLYLLPEIQELGLSPGVVNCKAGKVNIHTILQNDCCFNTSILTQLEKIEPPQSKNAMTIDEIQNVIKCNHLDKAAKTQLCKLIADHSSTLKLPDNNLSATNLLQHRIETTDDLPVYSRNYRYPYAFQEAIREEIDKLIKEKIVRPSNSPYNSPLWVVPKKLDASGKKKVRLVVDYRKLNNKTKDDKFPIPNIEDILSKLGQATYFSSLDLASGFHQIEVRESDIPKTAFSTESGHWEFTRMPFGLKNGPPTFQRMMNAIFADVPNTLIYMDDIIVYSSSLQEHIQDIRRVLQKLQQHNLQLQLDKSEFIRSDLLFLGHIISKDGIKPNPDKIKAVVDFPLPKTEKQIKQFLGLTGYYRRLIKDYAKIAQPLSHALRKTEGKIKFDEPKFVEAFANLKKALTNDPVLRLPNFEQPFVLTTDASNFALGGVLSQKVEGIEHPIAYASRTLNPAESNLDTTEKEVLAIIWCVKHFRPYLYGRKFTLRTDHQPLKWLKELKEPNAKLTRWRLALEEFDYTIEYIPGKTNKVADALSRVELFTNDAAIVSEEIVEPSREQRSIGSSCETVHSQLSSDERDGIAPPGEPVNKEQRQIVMVRGKFHVQTIKVFDKDRLIIQVESKQELKNVLDIIVGYLRPKLRYGIHFKLPFPQFEDDAREIILEFKFLIQNYIQGNKFIIYDTMLEDVEKVEEQTELIAAFHEGKLAHRGINENFTRLRRRYYWPAMVKHITTFINNCTTCNRVKYDRKPLKPPFEKTPTPTRPFQSIQMDIFSFKSVKILTISDNFSKLLFCYPLSSNNRIEVIKALRYYLAIYPTPEILTCDNATEFSNPTVCQFVTLHAIKMHFISSGHPDSLGSLERIHSTLREIMVGIHDAEKNSTIETIVFQATNIYNNTIGYLLKMTPFELAFGPGHNLRDIELNTDQILTEQLALDRRMELEAFHKAIRKKLETEKEDRTNKLNTSRKDSKELPQNIFVKSIQNKKHLPKFEKAEKVGDRHVSIKSKRVLKIHPSRVKRPKLFVPDERPGDNPPASGSNQ
jgi:hypothetical protein